MNERLKDLAAQAFFETDYDDAQNLPETMERFAELIIAECCVTADANIDDTKYPSYWIKRKFGVEE